MFNGKWIFIEIISPTNFARYFSMKMKTSGTTSSKKILAEQSFKIIQIAS